MRKVLIATTAAALLFAGGTAARAADLGLAGSTYDWSGGYVGVNAGAGFNNSNFKTSYRYTGADELDEDTQAAIDDLGMEKSGSDTAFEGGITAGYNWQISNFVLGLEGDFNYIGFDGTVSGDDSHLVTDVLGADGGSATDKIDYQSNWFGTVRARAGYAFDNILIYGTGGLAYGLMDANQKLNAAADPDYIKWSGSNDSWNLGWTAGAGIEYGIDHWTIGAEYLYVDLGSYSWSSNANVSLSDDQMQTDWSQVRSRGTAEYAFSLARATLKYRF